MAVLDTGMFEHEWLKGPSDAGYTPPVGSNKGSLTAPLGSTEGPRRSAGTAAALPRPHTGRSQWISNAATNHRETPGRPS